VIRAILDFETASPVSLKDCGAAVYSEHPLTEVLCLVWRIEGSDEFGVWSPWLDEYRDLAPLRALVENPDVVFASHAAFEQFIWRNIMVPLGMPELPPERWEDTQATAAWYSLPLKLEKLCQVLGLAVQKDMEGSRLTIGLSKPNKKTGMLDRSRATLLRVVDYCKTDVAGEEATLRRLGSLSRAERMVWLLDQEINHRGVRLDMEFVRAAQLVVDRASMPLAEEFRDLTGGINPGQRDKVIEWCAGQGVELENLQKGYLAGLLGEDEETDDAGYESLSDEENYMGAVPPVRLPTEVRRVLEIRQMLGSASIKKLARMRACVGGDGRARGLTQYHAAHPGRWGGRLLQPQNFPRGTGLDPDAAVEAICTGDCTVVERALGVPAIEAVASSLRHALIPDDGMVFEVGDFAGIEMRVDLALAGQHDKCELLASGADAYLDMACAIWRKPLGAFNKDDHKRERQAGKSAVLGCGFQMGAPKFQAATLKQYQVTLTDEEAQTAITAYRQTWAPKVPALWNALKWAGLECVRNGKTVTVYGCVLRRHGEFMAIDLPSGWQTIWYYQPAMRERLDPRTGERSWQPSYKAMKMGKWTTIFLYGGILCENIVQALARGLLVSAMGRLTKAGHPLVLSVHDEAICEVPEAVADKAMFQAIMEERPAWAERMVIPIAVDAWVGNRYRK
jgi:DNA polymerase